MTDGTFLWLCGEIRRCLPRRHRFLFDALADELGAGRAATPAGIRELADHGRALEEQNRQLREEVARLRAAGPLPAEVIEAVSDGFFGRPGGRSGVEVAGRA